ncbi:flagellar export protein FliJ [Desulfurivibrio alkaliphilus]|uniref:Flagellar FliJ protein n=1 Tax=Desulfurivibrio alkaliphilus (strain DSM 19089 / UNIQEM U267 / AHT2) TaxID=589865 RepID=D6Z2V7_DESAT|nr:flagellar export protein FliJ [Desulfurivibrio alkaliphilus]ADH85882.1 flagellar export protein FliJ [Desulfurivibrio alkaliphilus AHT 2]
MAYRFRFESVLGYRRNLEELARQKMVRAQTQLLRQQERLQEMEKELAAAIDAFEERKRKPMAAPFYGMYAEGIERLERDLVNQQRAVTTQVEVVEQARRELQEKVQQRKVMEKARERDYEKYLQEERLREQNELDEQMILRFKRR